VTRQTAGGAPPGRVSNLLAAQELHQREGQMPVQILTVDAC